MKHCNSCQSDNPLSEFYKRGLKSYQHKCKTCERNYKIINSDQQKILKRKHYLNNTEKIIKRTREHRSKNKTRRNEVERIYLTNPVNKLIHNMRVRIRQVLIGGNNKSETTIKLVGCDKQLLIKHIEARFNSSMTWQNYGSIWSLDHIIPCAKFDLSKPEEQKQCFHYTNLQPLFCKENSSKQDKILNPIQSYMPI